MKAWIALMLLAVASCDSTAACHCPANGCDTCSQGTTVVSVPSGLAAVSGAAADSPCSATIQAAD